LRKIRNKNVREALLKRYCGKSKWSSLHGYVWIFTKDSQCTYTRNIEMCSRQNSCWGKAKCIKYSAACL